MPRKKGAFPSELEYMILKLLWDDSPQTVRKIRDDLAENGRDIAYASVITTMNIMVRKKYLTRQKEGKTFWYSPKVKMENINTGMLGDLVKRIFDGSSSAVVLNLLQQDEIETEELKELRRLINRKMRERNNE